MDLIEDPKCCPSQGLFSSPEGTGQTWLPNGTQLDGEHLVSYSLDVVAASECSGGLAAKQYVTSLCNGINKASRPSILLWKQDASVIIFWLGR